MAGVRMTGLASGLDTESLVGQLSEAYQKKVDNVKKQQTKAEWKKEAWASLNTKLMNFYKGALSTFKSTSTYNSKAVKGDFSGVKITANSSAVSGSHRVQVKSTASAQMWTGKKINTNKYAATSYVASTDEDTKISDLYDKNGYSIKNALNGSSFSVQEGDGNLVDVNIQVDENTTVKDLVDSVNQQLADGGITGLTASFEKGALKFTNTSATELTNDAGETTYSGGSSMTITAKDQASATALGLTYNENGKGTVVNPLSATNKSNAVAASAFAYEKKVTADSKVTGSSRVTDLGIAEGTILKVNGQEIAIDRNTTLDSLAKSMANTGINASYDANQGRFYLSSKNTGTENAFTVEADDDTLAKFGLNLTDGDPAKIAASNASITYNGVDYEQATNSFQINGLTFDVTKEGQEMDFTVENDVDGIYDKVKSFVKEYNELITEMNKLYNAESSRGYEPLTSEEKDAMTEEDVKNWEDKIKGSLLRRDSTISSLLTNMRTILNKSVAVTNSDGSTSRFALSSFGITTGTYTENGQLHIQGNSEDADYMDMEDKLRAAIAANPDAVTKTLTSLGTEMYEHMQKAMRKQEGYSSALTFYNDIQLDSDIRDYKDKVKEEQEKMMAEEDKYYKQFSAMETAMAKLQSQQSYVSQLFGG